MSHFLVAMVVLSQITFGIGIGRVVQDAIYILSVANLRVYSRGRCVVCQKSQLPK